MPAPQPNWPELIAEIEATGQTRYKIAVVLGVRIEQLERIRSGVEPRHSVGETLIALHSVLVRKSDYLAHT